MRDDLEFWIQLHFHPKIEMSFKFIPKILMSNECIHFLGPLCIYACSLLCRDREKFFHNKATRSALFWDITQRRVIINHRRFGETYLSHLQVSRNLVFLKSPIERSAIDGGDYEV
jgi:hypothetical protein